MSWADLNVTEISSRRSPVESEAFGLTVGRIAVPPDGSDMPLHLMRAIRELDVDLAVVRVPSRLSQLGPSLALELSDYAVLHVDTLLYWTFDAHESQTQSEEGFTISDPDAGEASKLVGTIFRGYQNHYAANPVLKAVPPAAAYAEWTRRHIEGGSPAVVIERSGDLIAIATLEVAAEHVEILLAGVVEEYRGEGVYRKLLEAVIDAAIEQESRTVLISTQAHNVSVQRAWARFGFLPLASFETLHVMKRSAVLLG